MAVYDSTKIEIRFGDLLELERLAIESTDLDHYEFDEREEAIRQTVSAYARLNQLLTDAEVVKATREVVREYRRNQLMRLVDYDGQESPFMKGTDIKET